MKNPELFDYVLRIADNSLILGQRLGEWCGHGPVLEEDIAMTNHALDYLGQATHLFGYAAQLAADGRSDDDIALLRDEGEYKNLLLVELPIGDYACTIARQFLFSKYSCLFYEALKNSKDEFLKSFASKASKETAYHAKHAADWVLRMGDGTAESHLRIQNAFNELWEYTGEMFTDDELDRSMIVAGIGVSNAELKSAWQLQVEEILVEATIKIPANGWMHKGGKLGMHSEHLGHILAEMQFLPRAFPGAKW